MTSSKASQSPTFRICAPTIEIENEATSPTYMRLALRYTLDELNFTEILTFTIKGPVDLTDPTLLNLCNLAAAILGVSYFKLKAPQLIQSDLSFSTNAHALIKDVYENGLGEFYARNNLKRFGRMTYDFAEDTLASARAPRHTLPTKPLILIGGGKDSLVSVNLAEKLGLEFTPFAVNPKGPILTSFQQIKRQHTGVKRVLDPLMLSLNRQPQYYNGHVPSTGINSIIAAIFAHLSGHDAVILSNERSASQGNMEYDSRTVNHQHSKSFAFEQLFASALNDIAPHIAYFSLLRPFSELHIARIFSETDRFDAVFSSCNQNFKLGGNQGDLWCCDCPKCQFVYLMFAPHMKPERLRSIFGQDLFNMDKLNDFQALCGLTDQKPWECVGEYEEAAVAFHHLADNGDCEHNPLVTTINAELLSTYGKKRLVKEWQLAMKPSKEHAIPENLAKRVFEYVA